MRHNFTLINIRIHFIVCWNASCCMVVALAVNRYVFMTSPVIWTNRLFGGKRIWCWVAFAITFGAILCIMYSSKYATMIVDTKLGLYEWPSNDMVGYLINFVTLQLSS